MPRNTPLRFMGVLRQRHQERKAQRREKLMGVREAMQSSGGPNLTMPFSGAGGSSGGGGGGLFGLAHDIFAAKLKPKATEAGVPEHSHDIDDTDVESPMAKKLKFGRKK